MNSRLLLSGFATGGVRCGGPARKSRRRTPWRGPRAVALGGGVLLGLMAGFSAADCLGDGVEYRTVVTQEPSLIAYYPFDGDVGPAVHDVRAWGSPNQAHDGALEGNASFARPGRIGCQALQPSEGQVALEVSSAFDFLDASGSVEALLFQSRATPGYNPCFFSSRDLLATRYSLHGDEAGRGLWFWNGADAVFFEIPAGRASMIGRWVHVMVVFESGTVSAYLDGQPLGTRVAELGPASLNLPVQIGASSPYGSELWPGWIDELAIYEAPLVENSVVDHFFAWISPSGDNDRSENSKDSYACSLGSGPRASGTGNLDSAAVLWWNWQAPASGWVLATATGTGCVGMNLAVEAVNEADFASATTLGWNSGSPHYGGSGRSAVAFLAQAGGIYRFGVSPGPYSFPSTYGSECDPFLIHEPEYRQMQYGCGLQIEQMSPPTNDARAAAEVIEGEFPAVRGTNWGATRERGDPEGIPGLTGATVWWRWRAPSSRQVTVSTRGSEIHTFLAVYEVDPSGNRTLLASNTLAPELEPATVVGPLELRQTQLPASLPFPAADVLRRTSRVTFDARQGSEYLVAVDGLRYADGAEGMGDIRLTWEAVVMDAYSETRATTNSDLSVSVQGEVRLSNGGLADTGPVRVRLVGTRIYPGTARSRDPGRQEAPAAGTNLADSITVDPLSTGGSKSLAVDFILPPPDPGRRRVVDEAAGLECLDPSYADEIDDQGQLVHPWCYREVGPSTRFAYGWRAGLMIEAALGPQRWVPLAYYPLRHGPWPLERIPVIDGSGPYGGPGHTGYGGYGQWHGTLKLTAPEQLVARTQAEIDGTYEVYREDELDDQTATGDRLELSVVSGPGQLVGPRTVAALPTAYEANLVLQGTYRPGDGKEYTTEKMIRVVPGPDDVVPPSIRGFAVTGVGAQRRLELEVQAGNGLEVRVESRADWNAGSAWQPLGDWQVSDGAPRTFVLPMYSDTEYFRIVGRRGGG